MISGSGSIGHGTEWRTDGHSRIYNRLWDVTSIERYVGQSTHPFRGVAYFARDPLRSHFHEPQKNEIYFLNIYIRPILPSLYFGQLGANMYADERQWFTWRYAVLWPELCAKKCEYTIKG